MQQYVCPACGSDDLAELSVYVVEHPVRAWTESGEPMDYDLAQVDWNSQLPYSEFFRSASKDSLTLECRFCRAQFERAADANLQRHLRRQS
jgi:hypothetical protein